MLLFGLFWLRTVMTVVVTRFAFMIGYHRTPFGCVAPQAHDCRR